MVTFTPSPFLSSHTIRRPFPFRLCHLHKQLRQKTKTKTKMEDTGSQQPWNFGINGTLERSSKDGLREILYTLRTNLDPSDPRPVIALGHGDPSSFPSFRIDEMTENAVVKALRSAKFNSYSYTSGIPIARKAVAEYLSRDLPYKIYPDDVHVVAGCKQAIEVVIAGLARPGANILLPRPGFSAYESRASFSQLEVRHFQLLPEKDWEVDLDEVEALADDKTAAILIINPCNPCGNVLSRQHLQKIAETARKLGILVIADEVYERFAFGNTAFVSMAEFADIVPVIKLSGLSKGWFLPGWRLGWMVTFDPHNIMKQSGLVRSFNNYLNMATDPVTFIQGAIPEILGKREEEGFWKKLELIRECAEICYEEMKKIPCLTCPSKPQGSMFFMVKLNPSLLQNVKDDLDFCCKLAKEESLIILPGRAVGMKNWLRITFAVEMESLRDGLLRLSNFAHRHSKY